MEKLYRTCIIVVIQGTGIAMFVHVRGGRERERDRG
jgi:hypothetical protein